MASGHAPVGSARGVSLTLTEAAYDAPEVQALVQELDADLDARYPGEGIPPPLHLPEHYAPPSGAFLVARVDGTPAGCGGFREGPSALCAEVKRMYVAPAGRGRGVGRAVLTRLQALARERGYVRMVLETGVNQPEAIGLYESAGWRPVPLFGHYSDSPLSRCFGIELR